MKRWLIIFGGSAYDSTIEKTVSAAPGFGADEIIVYDDKWLMESPFWEPNKWLWDREDNRGAKGRGFLWFSWKPYIITETMKLMADGDVVMYLDADTYPIADFRCLYGQCAKDGGIMAFMATGKETALRNGDWNKRDCMIQMGMDEPRWLDAGAAVARFMLFQKGALGVAEFLEEWQRLCLDPICQTFDESTLAPEHPGFREHRVEQAIYTNLCHRYGLKLYREACGFGQHCPQDWDLYGQLFVQKYADAPKDPTKGSRFRNA